MKILLTFFFLLLLILLPLTTNAELIGTVVSISSNRNEIIMTNLKDIGNQHLLYQHNSNIHKLSVQENSRYIAIVSENENDPHQSKENLYLVNILQNKAVLIKEGFDNVVDIDMSYKGDIILSYLPINPGILKKGIYLIKRQEIGKQNPKIMLIKAINSSPSVDWGPNGKQIVYGSYNGVFLIDVETKNETLISKKGKYPSLSPDGKKVAYSYFNAATGNIQIDILSLETRQPIRIINDFLWHQHPTTNIQWSPDGEYLIYSTRVRHLLDQKSKVSNIAVPVNGGLAVRIDVGIHDWFNPVYPVEPVNRLTTLWGKIKQ